MFDKKECKSQDLILDVIQIAKYLCWHNETGNEKAQEIINEIHCGKYDSLEGIWPQVDKAISVLFGDRKQ